MKQFSPASASLLLIACGFGCLAAEPPSALAVIERAVAVQKEAAARGVKFTWREEQEQVHQDRKGGWVTKWTKTYDVIMLEGATYKKLVLQDGKPLDAKTQKKVDADLEKERADRRKTANSLTHKRMSVGDTEQLLRLFDSRVVGEEAVGGRNTWKVESTARADVTLSSDADKSATSSRRTTWFDKEEGVVVKRVDATVRASNGFQPGTEIEMNFAPVAGEWELATLNFRYDVKFAPMVRVRGEDRHRMLDYKRFEVDSKLKPE